MGAVTHWGRSPAAFPFSPMTLAEGRFYLSGQVGQDSTGRIEFPDCYRQALTLLENIRGMLAEAGLDFAQITRMTVFLTDMGDREAFERAFRRVFLPASGAVSGVFLPENDAGPSPWEAGISCTCVGVAALPNPAAVVEVEMEGVAVPD